MGCSGSSRTAWINWWQVTGSSAQNRSSGSLLPVLRLVWGWPHIWVIPGLNVSGIPQLLPLTRVMRLHLVRHHAWGPACASCFCTWPSEGDLGWRKDPGSGIRAGRWMSGDALRPWAVVPLAYCSVPWCPRGRQKPKPLDTYRRESWIILLTVTGGKECSFQIFLKLLLFFIFFLEKGKKLCMVECMVDNFQTEQVIWNGSFPTLLKVEPKIICKSTLITM